MQKRYRSTRKRIQDYKQKDTGLEEKDTGHRATRIQYRDTRIQYRATRIQYRDTRIGKNIFLIFFSVNLKTRNSYIYFFIYCIFSIKKRSNIGTDLNSTYIDICPVYV